MFFFLTTSNNVSLFAHSLSVAKSYYPLSFHLSTSTLITFFQEIFMNIKELIFCLDGTFRMQSAFIFRRIKMAAKSMSRY